MAAMPRRRSRSGSQFGTSSAPADEGSAVVKWLEEQTGMPEAAGSRLATCGRFRFGCIAANTSSAADVGFG